ncbi:hypothetical protein DIC82_03870 [Clostridium beijerinckii]|nr:hypothetical protein DIC82_03870 [Clostridium beijerinckii]
MNNLVPMILTMVLSKIIYIKIDKKYDITNKLCTKLHIEQEWISFYGVCFGIISIIIIEVLSIEIINIPEVFYYISGGIFAGIGIGTNNKNVNQ